MGVLGAFILFIACINFINLATALSEKKSKEIGIRKTLGAQRGQLTIYFLSETFLLNAFCRLTITGRNGMATHMDKSISWKRNRLAVVFQFYTRHLFACLSSSSQRFWQDSIQPWFCQDLVRRLFSERVSPYLEVRVRLYGKVWLYFSSSLRMY